MLFCPQSLNHNVQNCPSGYVSRLRMLTPGGTTTRLQPIAQSRSSVLQLRNLIIYTVDKLKPHILCHGYYIMKTFESERRHYNNVGARKQKPKWFIQGKQNIQLFQLWQGLYHHYHPPPHHHLPICHYIALKLFVIQANIHVNFGA